MDRQSRFGAFLLAVVLGACQTVAPSASMTATVMGPSATDRPLPTPDQRTPRPTAPAPTGRIIFTRGGDIWLINADGTGLVPVTTTPQSVFEEDPYWLLDGSRIVFARTDYDVDPYHGRLISTLPDGSNERDLGPVQPSYLGDVPSPDGRYVVWGADGAGDDDDGLTLLDLSTGSSQRITNDGATMPIWSPDSQRILALRNSRGAIVVEVATGRSVVVVRDDEIEEPLGWSPDGASVYFASGGFQDDRPDIYVVPAEGGMARLHEGELPLGGAPLWSPDGRFVGRSLAPTMYDGPWLYVSEAGSTDPAPLSKDYVAFDEFSWSPDGAWIAFNGNNDGDVSGARTIHLIELNRGTVVQLTTGTGDRDPSWEPRS